MRGIKRKKPYFHFNENSSFQSFLFTIDSERQGIILLKNFEEKTFF
jgi:hypothetical protein